MNLCFGIIKILFIYVLSFQDRMFFLFQVMVLLSGLLGYTHNNVT